MKICKKRTDLEKLKTCAIHSTILRLGGRSGEDTLFFGMPRNQGTAKENAISSDRAAEVRAGSPLAVTIGTKEE